MSATNTVHPLSGAAQRALVRAASLGGAKLATWDSTAKCWNVASATTPGRVYHVSRVHLGTRAESAGALKPGTPNPIGWLFTLTCDCQTYHDSREYKACWHKAAVRLWWTEHAALDGDQIARRNLARARWRRAEIDRDLAEENERTQGSGAYQHTPPRDAQDGADAHTFNRRVRPLDRGRYHEDAAAILDAHAESAEEEGNVFWEERHLLDNLPPEGIW